MTDLSLTAETPAAEPVREHLSQLPTLRQRVPRSDERSMAALALDEKRLYLHMREALLLETGAHGVLETWLVERITLAQTRLIYLYAFEQELRRRWPQLWLADMSKLAAYERQIDRTFRASLEELRWLQNRRSRQADKLTGRDSVTQTRERGNGMHWTHCCSSGGASAGGAGSSLSSLLRERINS
jgi:hypothetical protein